MKQKIDSSIIISLNYEFINYLNVTRNYNDKLILGILEERGYEVGKSLSEILTLEFPYFGNEDQIFRIICKELWIKLFGKIADKLETNKKGVYIITDSKFLYLINIPYIDEQDHSDSENDMNDEANHNIYLSYTCGILKGVLENCGYEVEIKTIIRKMPFCQFHVSIIQANEI